MDRPLHSVPAGYLGLGVKWRRAYKGAREHFGGYRNVHYPNYGDSFVRAYMRSFGMMSFDSCMLEIFSFYCMSVCFNQVFFFYLTDIQRYMVASSLVYLASATQFFPQRQLISFLIYENDQIVSLYNFFFLIRLALLTSIHVVV